MKQGGRATASESVPLGERRVRSTRAIGFAGFTIVETVIVLAVTSLLLISAMVIISGRQARTSFQISINNMQQQIQQIINETASGFAQATTPFSCTPASPPVIVAHNASYDGNCIFIGKAVRFGQLGSDVDSTKTITVYPLVASRLGSDGKEQQGSTTQPWFTAVATGTANNSLVYRGENGLNFEANHFTVPSGAQGDAPRGSVTVIVFAQSLASYKGDGATQQLNAGSQQVSMYGLDNPGGGWDSASNQPGTNYMSPDLVTRINGSTLIPLDNTKLCFASGTTNQSGLITIDDGLGVHTQIKDGLTCGY